MSRLIDLVGKRFGRLVVISKANKNKWGKLSWLCCCDCGKKTIVIVSDLKNSKTRSCGCLHHDKITKHGHTIGHTPSKIYQSWNSMVQRCTNKNSNAYKNYGGRGITVCTRWLKFENFLDDMGECPEGFQIDRINNNDGYHPSNCQWVTPKMNNRNRRNNRLINFNGTIQCLAAWAEQTGIPRTVLEWRLNHGWSIKQTLTESVGARSCKGVS